MDWQFDTMTENGLVSLADAGCTIEVSINSSGGPARVRAKITTGTAAWGGPGLCLVVEGEGKDGAASLRGAVATAETYLGLVPPRRPAPVLPEMPAAADAMTDRDPVALAVGTGRAPTLADVVAVTGRLDATDARRQAAIASGVPQAGDRARAAEDVEALS